MIYIHSLTHSFILEGFAEPQPKYAEQDYKDGKHGPSLHTPHRIERLSYQQIRAGWCVKVSQRPMLGAVEG